MAICHRRPLNTLISLLVWIGACGRLLAQTPPRSELDVNQFIQDFFQAGAEEGVNEELVEALFLLYTNPLDLNTATADELAATFILSHEQIKAFLSYRQQAGPLSSLYELQALPELDLATIRRLIPFVTINTRAPSLRDGLRQPTQHFLILRSRRVLEPARGFMPIDSGSRSTTRYAGDPYQHYLRYRYARAGAYSFGFTLEKDPGELLFYWDPKRRILGPDFSSFHAQLQNRGRLKNLIIGDFQMQAGQGLVMAGGFAFGKGAEVIRTTYRSTLGLRPYTSVLEAGFFRGAAATYALSPRVELTTFVSYTHRSASTVEDDSSDTVISSLLTSGLHRTPSERARQGSITEQNMGLHALYTTRSRNGQLGVTALHTTFGGAQLQRRDLPYNRFEFRGNENLLLGLHGNYRWQNIHLFGEAARSQSGGIGALGGMIAPLSKTLDLSVLARHYDRHFHSFYGNAFSEGSRPINEQGIYWALRYTPSRAWQFSAFYDRFRFPWLRYRVHAPSAGDDYFVHAQYTPNKRLRVYALYHEKNKALNLPNSGEIMAPVVTTTRRTALINFDYDSPLRYHIRSRIQLGDFTYQGFSRSRGIALVQDLSWRWPRWELSGRMAFFNTDDFDSRLYVYEKDVLYAFSLPTYSDQGTRHYLMARYTLSKHTKLWVRWAQTRYLNRKTISSGLDEIQGRTRSELKLQLMYQW
jgi:hypothetical protein